MDFQVGAIRKPSNATLCLVRPFQGATPPKYAGPMAFKSANLTLTASTATPLLVKGTGTGQFNNITGTVEDPIPVMIMNTSVTSTVIGGPNAGSAGDLGFPLIQNVPLVMNLYGPTEIPYAFSTGTPTIYILVGRQ